MRDGYMRTREGFLLVYSITSRASFNEIEVFRKQILRVKDTDHVPMFLVGNKCDLENERVVTTAELQERAKQWKCEYAETSALQRLNVQEAFFGCSRQIKKYREEQNQMCVESGEMCCCN